MFIKVRKTFCTHNHNPTKAIKKESLPTIFIKSLAKANQNLYLCTAFKHKSVYRTI